MFWRKCQTGQCCPSPFHYGHSVAVAPTALWREATYRLILEEVRRLCGFLILIGLVATVAAPAPNAFSELDAIVIELSRITGLTRLKKVQYDKLDRAALRRYLDRKIKEENSPEDIRLEELALKKFGLVPAGFDLAKSTVDLMTEQAAAFYDERQKKLFLLDDASSSGLEQVALVHELAHALADQHFHLGKFIRTKGRSDDSQLARMAVVEGQATWLMTEYMARRSGQSLRKSPALLSLFAAGADTAGAQFSQFRDSPLYVRELLLFPYVQGARFQQAVLEKQGDEGFANVFRRPPTTTQQIVHPERYFAGEGAASVDPPAVPKERDYKGLLEGSVGEFDHAVLLRQYVPVGDSEALAAHWRGGTFRLYEARGKQRQVLAYASVWDSPSKAGEFFQQYEKILKGKWKQMKVNERTPQRLTGEGDDGRFILTLDGDRVTSCEGLPAPE